MLKITTNQDQLLVRFPPRLDTASCSQWQADLLARTEAHTGPIVFDLSDVAFVASVFLRICMQVYKKEGAQLQIIGLSPDVKKVFKIAGMDQHLSLQ